MRREHKRAVRGHSSPDCLLAKVVSSTVPVYSDEMWELCSVSETREQQGSVRQPCSKWNSTVRGKWGKPMVVVGISEMKNISHGNKVCVRRSTLVQKHHELQQNIIKGHNFLICADSLQNNLEHMYCVGLCMTFAIGWALNQIHYLSRYHQVLTPWALRSAWPHTCIQIQCCINETV